MTTTATQVEGLVLNGRFVLDQFQPAETADGMAWAILEVRKVTGEPYWARVGVFGDNKETMRAIASAADQQPLSVAVEMRKGKTSGAAYLLALGIVS